MSAPTSTTTTAPPSPYWDCILWNCNSFGSTRQDQLSILLNDDLFSTSFSPPRHPLFVALTETKLISPPDPPPISSDYYCYVVAASSDPSSPWAASGGLSLYLHS